MPAMARVYGTPPLQLVASTLEFARALQRAQELVMATGFTAARLGPHDLTIRVRRLPSGRWEAGILEVGKSFRGFPFLSAFGESAESAAREFCDLHRLDLKEPLLGWDRRDQTIREMICHAGRSALWGRRCPDCKGTGEYRGLFAVEKCGTCDGSGSC
jgi:hypothetical protein